MSSSLPHPQLIAHIINMTAWWALSKPFHTRLFSHRLICRLLLLEVPISQSVIAQVNSVVACRGSLSDFLTSATSATLGSKSRFSSSSIRSVIQYISPFQHSSPDCRYSKLSYYFTKYQRTLGLLPRSSSQEHGILRLWSKRKKYTRHEVHLYLFSYAD